eukprot:gb/GECG01012604.1/.p1 GENE.gb/GECG01012604.1/~~gb/GECG01012604.1/.p1  ORF type:complete len:101 (+),score=5.56 gb/GECG01012604.1/:1-303(+)
MSAQATRFSSLWRRAGLNYLQQVNIATHALRNTLKEPQRSEAFGRSTWAFRQVVYQDGKEMAPGMRNVYCIVPQNFITIFIVFLFASVRQSSTIAKRREL